MIDLNALKTHIDFVRRRTPPQDVYMHQFLDLAAQATTEIEALIKDRDAAWGDADMTAWRDYARSYGQAVATMVGVRPAPGGGLTPAIDNNGQLDETTHLANLGRVAKLAEEYASVAMVADRRRRKEAAT